MTHTVDGCKQISSARPALPSFLDKPTSKRLWFCFLHLLLFTAVGNECCQGDSSDPQNPPKELSLFRNCFKDALFRLGLPRLGRHENKITDSHLCLLLPRSP